MAYGLNIDGANNSFVFDSTIAGATAMPVIQGSTSVTSGNAYSGYTVGDLIFARPATGFLNRITGATITAAGTGYTSAPTVTFSGGGAFSAATGTATISGGGVTGITITNAGTLYTSAPTIAFSGGGGSGAAATATGLALISSDWTQTTPEADGNQEFILLRPSDTAGLATNQNGSTYGLQIFDADGTTVMYDSRHTSSGLDIKAGAGTGFTGGGAFSGSTFVPDTSNSNLLYASANANTYVLMSTGYSRVMGFITVKIGYSFSSTNIYYAGYYHYSGFGSTGQGGLPSSSQMIIGDLVT